MFNSPYSAPREYANANHDVRAHAGSRRDATTVFRMTFNSKRGGETSILKVLKSCSVILLVLSCKVGVALAEEDRALADWQIQGALAAFDDENHVTKALALEKLAKLGAIEQLERERIREVVSALVDLKGYGGYMLSQVLQAMGEHSRDAVPVLIDLLRDEEPRVREAAAWAGEAMGEHGRDAVPNLIDLLRDEEPRVREAAARAVEAMGEHGRNAVPVLIDSLRDEEPKVREAAAWTLGAMGGHAQGAVPALIDLLRDEDPGLRSSATQALEAMGEHAQRALPALIELLLDDDPYLGGRAAWVLEFMGEHAQGALPALIELLRDDDPYLGARAAWALGSLGEHAQKAVPNLIELLQDEDPGLRSNAAWALGTMGDNAQKAVPNLIELLQDDNWQVRANALDALQAVGEIPQDTVPKLLNFLQDEDPLVRASALMLVEAMSEHAGDVVQELINLLWDELWWIRGRAAWALGAIGDNARKAVPDLIDLLWHESPEVRSNAAWALGAIGEHARYAIPEIINLLWDDNPLVRQAAIEALKAMGRHGQYAIPKIIELFWDDSPVVRQAAVEAILAMGGYGRLEQSTLIDLLLNRRHLPARNEKDLSESQSPYLMAHIAENELARRGPFPMSELLTILAPIHNRTTVRQNPGEVGRLRFWAYFLTGGDEDVEILLRWIGIPAPIPTPKRDQDLSRALDLLGSLWPKSEDYPFVRQDMAHAIGQVVHVGRVNREWSPADIGRMRAHAERLEEVRSPFQRVVEQVVADLQRTKERRETLWSWSMGVGGVIASHALFWALLLARYPRSPKVQEMVFWNPWARRLLGFCYVSLLLTWVPLLRRRMLAPFRAQLIEDIHKDSDEPYFPESKVRKRNANRKQMLVKAIPRVEGRIVLEGESGLGKTTFVRRLVTESRDLFVYLRATDCDNGITEALQKRLLGPARDPKFLEALIFSGGVALCIDGLNEATAETRSRILEEVRRYSFARVLLVTQPILWTPPANAEVWELLPLGEKAIGKFLKSRPKPADAPLTPAEYRKKCDEFLKTELLDNEYRRILSNPMDLTTVAQLLWRGVTPDIAALQDQQFRLVQNQYRANHAGRLFPVGAFADDVYQMRLNECIYMTSFRDEMLTLEHFKLATNRPANGQDRWLFRHDRIIDYFVAKAMLNDCDKLRAHYGDERFRGAYLYLAATLTLSEAIELREEISDHAAETRDHSLSDPVRNIVANRRRASQVEEASAVPCMELEMDGQAPAGDQGRTG